MVLLDEPFSALDSPVRHELVREMRRLQHQAGLSTVLVTHDPEEAAMLADEILVIGEGRLLQAGPAVEVFRRPASPAVARLLQIENLLTGTAIGGGRIDVGGHPEQVERSIQTATELPAGTSVLWCVRPNQISVSRDGRYPGRIVDVVQLTTSVSITVRLDHGPELEAWMANFDELEVGELCRISIEPAAVAVWAAPEASISFPPVPAS